MLRVGIWEGEEAILPAVGAWADRLGAELLAGRHPGELAGRPLDLLVVVPGSAGWAGAGAVDCQTALLPGTAGPLARMLRPPQAVSYGTSPRDSLTFSSLEGDRLSLAIQRELVTPAGVVVERQELLLPFSPGRSPLPFLAAAGALLLMGIPPEELAGAL